MNFPTADASNLLQTAANLLSEEMRRGGAATKEDIICLMTAQQGIDQAITALMDYRQTRTP